MLKAVIFDYDGTLVDTIPQIYGEYLRAMKILGLREIGFDEFKRVIGLPWENVLTTLWPGIDVSEFSKVYRSGMESPKPFQDMDEVLRRLSKDYVLAMLTSRGEKTLTQQVNSLSLDMGLFKRVFHRNNTLYHKPDGRALKQVCESLSIASSDAVYVGDGFVDAECARNAGCRFIGVLSGGLSREDFEGVGVSEVISSISFLPKVL
ncbi:MAG: HAD family hydrolase [Candidatus Altiarchaeota archaeon]|nr:HAD family hydrolase [Candidatus Altiarchaeota archaeon]